MLVQTSLMTRHRNGKGIVQLAVLNCSRMAIIASGSRLPAWTSGGTVNKHININDIVFVCFNSPVGFLLFSRFSVIEHNSLLAFTRIQPCLMPKKLNYTLICPYRAITRLQAAKQQTPALCVRSTDLPQGFEFILADQKHVKRNKIHFYSRDGIHAIKISIRYVCMSSWLGPWQRPAFHEPFLILRHRAAAKLACLKFNRNLQQCIHFNHDECILQGCPRTFAVAGMRQQATWQSLQSCRPAPHRTPTSTPVAAR